MKADSDNKCSKRFVLCNYLSFAIASPTTLHHTEKAKV